MSKTGVFGPYKHGDRYRIIIRDAASAGRPESYATEEAARERKRILLKGFAALAGEHTVKEALNAYELQALKRERANNPDSITTTRHRLDQFFAPMIDDPIGQLTTARCAARYATIAGVPSPSGVVYKSPSTGKPLAVATHQAMLAEAKTFGKWCAEAPRRWVKHNPLGGVRTLGGEPNRGKDQLRIDEARRWLGVAMTYMNGTSDQRREGAVAATLSLIGAMRCSEITKRVVRDVDDDGRLLWVVRAKTPAGDRVIEVPPFLISHLKRLCVDKLPEAPLFGVGMHRDRAYPRKWVKRICIAAGVKQVTAHGMRGLHATLTVKRAASSHNVAAALDVGASQAPAPNVAAAVDAARAGLGHAHDGVTRSAYIAPGTVEQLQRDALVATLLPPSGKGAA